MSPEQKAYIAGIIDGEGSIMLIRFHKNQHPAPCVSIASTSIELLQWIQNTTQVGQIKYKKNYNPKKYQNSYTYTVRYNQALYLLNEIEPYLVIPQKKKKAQMIINEYKTLTPRNGRYSPELLKAKEEFYQRFMKLSNN